MSKQLHPKTLQSYEQALKLFARWLREAYLDVTDSDIRKRYSRFNPVDSIYYQNKSGEQSIAVNSVVL